MVRTAAGGTWRRIGVVATAVATLATVSTGWTVPASASVLPDATMVLASVDTAGVAFNGTSSSDVMSDDGRYVAFIRWRNGGDATPSGVYVFDATTGLSTYYGTRLGSIMDISGDGRFLLGSGMPNGDLIRVDRTTGAEVAVVVNRDGSAVTASCTNGICNGVTEASMSADGRHVAFASVEGNLVVGDTNGMADVFIRDMTAASTVRASVTTAGVEGSNRSFTPTISDDGKRVAFRTFASNMPGASDSANDKHVIRDLTAGTTVSVASPMTGVVTGSAMGGDGSVVFATDVGFVPTDTDGMNDVYVRRPAGAFLRVTNGMGQLGHSSGNGSVSATGRFVGFTTYAGLVPEDTNGYSDLYLWDSASRVIRRLSVSPTGEQIPPGSGNYAVGNPGASGPVHVSADGRSVSFVSTQWNLIPNDYNPNWEVFVATNDIPPVTPVGAGDTTGGSNPAESHAQCCVKDPINTATGELWEAVTDLSVPGRLPVVASRTYSSMRAGTAGLFGAGWSSPWDMAVTVSDTSTVVLQENGSRVVFTPGPNGTFTTPLSVHATLTRDTGTGEYTYVRRSDTTFRFDNTGRLISIADRNGETTTLSRPAGQLRVTSADGRVLTLNLDAGGTVGSLSGPEGRTVSYTYGAGGLLAQVLDSRGKTWTYGYDPTTKRMTSSTTPLGEVTTTEYDTAGRVSAQTDPMDRVSTLSYAVDGDRTTTRLTEPTGVVTLHKYWRGLLVARVVDPDGTPATWQYTYDIGNNLASSIDPTGVTTAATFDDAGNPLTHTDGAGNTTTVTYNQFNQPLAMKDPAGHTSSFTYDSAGNLLTTTVPQSATRAAVTTLTRDTAHKADVLSVTDADNRVSSMTYTAQGFAASRTAGDGGSETFTYDAYGAALTRVAPNGNVTGGTPATYTTTNTYGGGGLQLTSKNPLKHVTTFGYDDDGRLTSTQDPYGKTTTTAYFSDGTVKSVTDPMLRKTQFTHDASGKELSRAAPDGGVTTRTYDSHGRLATILKPSGNAAGATAIEKAARTITYGYDLAGRRILASQPDPSSPGAMLVQSSTYDAAGRLWKSRTATALTTTTYDSLGRVATVTDPAGKLTTFGYDWAGHRTSTTDPLSHTTTVTYSPAGTVTATADPLGNTTKFTYDAAGRPLTTISPRGTCASCTPANHTRTLGYDLNGNLTSSKDELGRTTTHTYDAADRHVATIDAKSRTTTLTHDDAGRLKTVKAPDTGTTAYGYNDAGDLTGATSPRLKATTYGYDSAGRPNSVIDALGRQRTRTYNLDGQIATEVTARGNAGATPATGTITYTYDDAARQTGISFGDGQPAVSFGYDSASRRTSMTDGAGTQTYTYDPNSRVTGIGRGSNGWVYTYYDDGTIKTRTRPDATVETHTYDLAGRPKTAVTPAGTTTYGWDADGNLATSALPNGSTETQTWDRAGHLSKIATTSGNKVVVSQTLTRDATNNPLETVTLRGRATDTRSFKYDPNDRLQGVCYTTQTACTGSVAATQWWTYDLDGNRTSEKNGTSTGTTTTYTYDDASQLTSTKVGTAAPKAHTYDADGNQLSEGTVTATYDLNNRAKTSTSGVTNTTWQRDGEGNPLSQTTGATTTQYRWDLNARVPRLASTTDAGSTTSYRYDPLGRAATLSSGTVHETAAHDPLGAPIDLISSAGAIVRSADWTPFGTDRAAIGAPATPSGPTSTIGFAGMVKGPSSSYLTLDRTYTPATGRWTATDPINPGVGSPFDSPYTYVGNRPGVFTDPLGQCAWQLLLCGGALGDIGQASRGVGDAAGQMAKDAANTVLHPNQVVENMVDAYRAEGFWYAANQLNPVYHTIDRYSAMWALANQGCVREAAAAGTNGAVALASTLTGAAGVARGVAGRGAVAAEGVAGPGSAVVKYSYPPNRGFLGGPVRTELKPGTVVDRYGADSGTFVSPQGTSFGQRSLPPSSLNKPFNTYEVVNPVQVNGGTVAPWFGQGGGGVQYEFGQSIAELIEGGFLKAVR